MTPVSVPPGVALASPPASGIVPAHDASANGAVKPDPKLAKIAQEFESIFLRNLLKPLEKSGEMGKQGSSVTSGSSVYGSMMVGALADSASSGGGIGLAHLVLEALTRGAAHAPAQKLPNKQ